MTATYISGELSHFLVGIVSRKMAQEIHYGDIGCVERENATDAGADCYKFTDNSRSADSKTPTDITGDMNKER